MAFHFHDWLRKKGKLGIVWLAAVDEKQIKNREWLSENLIQTCGFIRDYIDNEDKVKVKQKVVLGCIAENLAYGASVILRKKVQAFLDEILKGSDYFDRVERLKDRPDADESDGDDDDQPNGDEPRRKKPRFDINLHMKKNMHHKLPKSMFKQPDDFGRIEMFRSRLLYEDDEVSDFEFYQPLPIDEQPHIAPIMDITMAEPQGVQPQPDRPMEDLQEGVDEVFRESRLDEGFREPSAEKSDINVTASDTTTPGTELPVARESLQPVEGQPPKGQVTPEAVDEVASSGQCLLPIEEEEEISAGIHMPPQPPPSSPPPSPPKPKVPRRRRPRRDEAVELTDERLRNQINVVDDIPPLIDRWADVRRRVDLINVRDVLRLPGRRELGRNDIFCRVWDNRLLRPVNELEDVGILLPEGIPSPPHIERGPQPSLDEIEPPVHELPSPLHQRQPSLPEIPPALSPPGRPVATVIEEEEEATVPLPLSPIHPEQPLAVPSPPVQPPIAISPPLPPPVPLVTKEPSAKPTSAGPGPLPNGNGSPPHPPFPSPPPPPQPPVPGPLPNGNGRPPYPSPPPPMSPQPPVDLPEDEGRILIDGVRYKVFEELDMAKRIMDCIGLLNDGQKLTFEILAPPKGPTNRLGASVVFKHLLEFSRRRWLNVEQLDEFGTIEVTIRGNGIFSKLGGRLYISPPSSLSVVPSDVDVSQLSFPDDD